MGHHLVEMFVEVRYFQDISRIIFLGKYVHDHFFDFTHPWKSCRCSSYLHFFSYNFGQQWGCPTCPSIQSPITMCTTKRRESWLSGLNVEMLPAKNIDVLNWEWSIPWKTHVQHIPKDIKHWTISLDMYGNFTSFKHGTHHHQVLPSAVFPWLTTPRKEYSNSNSFLCNLQTPYERKSGVPFRCPPFPTWIESIMHVAVGQHGRNGAVWRVVSWRLRGEARGTLHFHSSSHNSRSVGRIIGYFTPW